MKLIGKKDYLTRIHQIKHIDLPIKPHVRALLLSNVTSRIDYTIKGRDELPSGRIHLTVISPIKQYYEAN